MTSLCSIYSLFTQIYFLFFLSSSLLFFYFFVAFRMLLSWQPHLFSSLLFLFYYYFDQTCLMYCKLYKLYIILILIDSIPHIFPFWSSDKLRKYYNCFPFHLAVIVSWNSLRWYCFEISCHRLLPEKSWVRLLFDPYGIIV